MLQNTLINHIAIVVDKSSSMKSNSQKVVEVFDQELSYLKKRSVELNQETRISIYLFNDKTEVLAFDMDIMRFQSLKDFYSIGGNTALIDATMLAIKDGKQLPQLYGDHAFLLYVITDGEENYSYSFTQYELAEEQESLPDNWTTVILIPNAQGEQIAIQYGFRAGAIRRWDTSSVDAMKSVGSGFRGIIDDYMGMRSKGVRGTRSFFEMNTGNLKKNTLKLLAPKSYQVFPVRKDDIEIRNFVELSTGEDYVIGSTYYVPTKPVVVQDHKHVLVRDRKTGKVYESDNIRQVLGLPDYEVKIKPDNDPNWEIFIQSTSVNRHLKKGKDIIVRL